MRLHFALCLAPLWLLACARPDEPPPSPGHRPPPTTEARAVAETGVARPPSTAAQARPAPTCVVPLPTVAPPAARRAASCPKDPSPDLPPLPTGRVVFADAPGAPAITVEVARAPEQRQRGLMYRTSLAEDRGMLFSWPEEQPRSFWMRNTCLPLDMMFIAADGTIAGILEQVPTLNEESRSVPCPARYVLEVNAGFTRAAGVRPGQRIEINE